MNVLIFEDEVPAYEKLVLLIEKELPECEIKGWARSVEEAKSLIDKTDQIDLVFSDIELLDGNSFEIYKAVDLECPIIFSTAFDQYLFDAFQVNGIAYLLKPYTRQKFQEAIEKYKTLFQSTEHSSLDANVIEELKSIIESDKKTYKKRFSVKKKGGIKILNVSDLIAFEANGDFCTALDKDVQKHIVNYTLGEIESKIDPSKFFRINRSEIINIDYIENIEPYFKNKLAIKMKTLSDPLYTSRAKTPLFRNWLDS